MTRQEVERQFPAGSRRMGPRPLHLRPAGRRKRPCRHRPRAARPSWKSSALNSADNVLVVSHKATIRLLLSSLLGFDPRRYRDNLDQSPAALNIVDFRDPTRARLTLFNDTSHYAAWRPRHPRHPHRPPLQLVERGSAIVE